MTSLSPIRTMIVGDIIRLYRILPGRLRAWLMLVFGYMLVLAVLEVVGILSLTLLSLSIVAPEHLVDQGVVASVLQHSARLRAFTADPRNLALVTSIGVVATIALKNAMAAFVGLETSRLGERVAQFAGESIFHQYVYSPYLQHLAGDGQAMFQAVSWRTSLGGLCINLLNVYCYAIVTTALTVALISTTPFGLMVTMGTVALVSWALYRALKRSVDRAGRTAGECSAREGAATMNAMNGIREVLIYRQQPVFFRAFADACRAGTPSRAFLAIAPPIPPWILEVIGFAVIPVTLWIMKIRHNATMAEMTGVLSMVMLASWRILPMLNRSMSCLVGARGMRHSALQCLDRVEQVVARPVTVPPEPDPRFAIRESITLDDVSFRYPNAAADVLHGVALTIPRGSQIGIIGPSGSGKSTIAAILSGLVPPSGGRLLVDGRPLDPAGLAAFTTKVGYVPQSPYIMPGTVAGNVAFSQWGRPYDAAKVRAACRLAALDLVETHPAGIEIPIGDRGAGISGGQAQRVCIARVLFADPELLILDEATSSLDQGTEAAIVHTVSALRGRLTTVVIAHRLTTVMHCDRIVWVEDGRIVDHGDPDEIIPRYERRLLVRERASSAIPA